MNKCTHSFKDSWGNRSTTCLFCEKDLWDYVRELEDQVEELADTIDDLMDKDESKIDIY